LQNLVILVSFSEQNVLKLLFTQSKNEAQMRQSKKKDGCQICVNKLTRKSANQRPSSPWAYLTKQILQVVT
jgi:hypothetical protein